MSNQQIKMGLVALVLTVIMVFAAALPAVNALTPSTIYERYAKKTDSTPGGQHICGEKLCSSGEWVKMKKSLHAAQSNPNVCKELRGWEYCGQQTVVPKTSNK